MSLGISSLLFFLLLEATVATSSLKIDTSSGPVQGIIQDSTPNVAQFLGIPFAEQPVGSRRWLPAIIKSRENGTIDATKLGPACPQYEVDPKLAPNLYVLDVPEFSVSPFDYQREDCLSVNVWTPWGESDREDDEEEEEEELLPVIVWLYGGAFVAGGANVPYFDPSPWVERSGRHLVVGIK